MADGRFSAEERRRRRQRSRRIRRWRCGKERAGLAAARLAHTVACSSRRGTHVLTTAGAVLLRGDRLADRLSNVGEDEPAGMSQRSVE